MLERTQTCKKPKQNKKTKNSYNFSKQRNHGGLWKETNKMSP